MDSFEYLERDLGQSIDQDVAKVAATGLGRYGVPRSVFSYIDHLGFLAYGTDGSTDRAVQFIREFFPSCYRNLAEVMIHMWRHGVIHSHKPRSLRHTLEERTVELRWLSTTHDRPGERGLHLLVFSIKGEPDAAYLVVNNPQLGADLQAAVAKFREKLAQDSTQRADCERRVATVGSAEEVAATAKPRRAEAIALELSKAWSGRGGLISSDGNRLERHPDEE